MRKNCIGEHNPQSCRGGYYPPMKKIIGLILTFALLLSFAPISASAAIVGSGKCGTNLTWTLDSNGTLTISGAGEMDCSTLPWNGVENKIKFVNIQNGVTSIGNSAFWGCTSLTSVTIPNSVTNIGDYAFRSCTSLTRINIPNSVSSIGYQTFDSCTSLTSVTLPNSVTSIGARAFWDCKGLTNVNISNSVTRIDYETFRDCTNLAIITIGDGLTSIGADAFINTAYYNNPNNWKNGVLYINKYLIAANQSELSNSYTIKDGTTVIGGSAFYDCNNLTSIAIPNSVTSIGAHAFRGCTSLTSINIPNSVTSIGESAFWVCTGLTNVSIPNSVTSIGSSAFGSCTSLRSVNIPNSVSSIGYRAFTDCTRLTSIDVQANNLSYSSADGVLFNKDKTTLVCYPAGKSDNNYTIPNNVTSIGSSAFYGCTSLTSINISNSVTSIGDCAFFDCSSLTSVSIPNSVTSIDDTAFYGCKSLKDVYYSGTEQSWQKIEIGYSNDYLINATIHYNYKSTPSEIKKVSLVSSRNGVYRFSAGYEAAERGKLVAVVYKDGAISGYTTLNVLPGSSTASVTVNAASGADNAKFFIWDSLENMSPLSDVYNMSL